MSGNDTARNRWTIAHGAGSQHVGTERGQAGGKKSYRTFWAAARVATEVNLTHRNDPEYRFVEPYSCRWATHWAHGETAELHWHLGKEPKRLL